MFGLATINERNTLYDLYETAALIHGQWIQDTLAVFSVILVYFLIPGV